MRPTLIYCATSPSGKSYVGLTNMGAKRRWQAHTTRAVRTDARHPLYDAIRKYGAGTFRVVVLEADLTREQAALAERTWIKRLRTIAPHGYNVSAGGENDGPTGAARLRELLCDPEWRASYIEKLRKGCLKRNTDPTAATVAAAGWREQNPRIAWEIARRASRIAARGRTESDPRFGPWGRLVIKSERVAASRRAYFVRPKVTAYWAAMPAEEKAVIGRKIGKTLSEYHKADPEAIAATLKETRSKIDRKHQAARASAGLKAWWAELREDPERYAEHMRKRSRARKNV